MVVVGVVKHVQYHFDDRYACGRKSTFPFRSLRVPYRLCCASPCRSRFGRAHPRGSFPDWTKARQLPDWYINGVGESSAGAEPLWHPLRALAGNSRFCFCVASRASPCFPSRSAPAKSASASRSAHLKANCSDDPRSESRSSNGRALAGLVLSFALTPLLQSLLFGVSPAIH